MHLAAANALTARPDGHAQPPLQWPPPALLIVAHPKLPGGCSHPAPSPAAAAAVRVRLARMAASSCRQPPMQSWTAWLACALLHLPVSSRCVTWRTPGTVCVSLRRASAACAPGSAGRRRSRSQRQQGRLEPRSHEKRRGATGVRLSEHACCKQGLGPGFMAKACQV